MNADTLVKNDWSFLCKISERASAYHKMANVTSNSMIALRSKVIGDYLSSVVRNAHSNNLKFSTLHTLARKDCHTQGAAVVTAATYVLQLIDKAA